MKMKFKNSIAFRFLFATVVLIMLAMGLGTTISSIITNRAMNEAAQQQLLSQVEDAVGFSEKWFHEQRVLGTNLTKEKVIKIALEQSFKGRAARRAVVEKFSRLALQASFIHSLNLLDINGKVLASDLPEEWIAALGVDIGLLKRASQGELVVSPIVVSQVDETKIFSMYFPVVNDQYVVSGVLYIEYSLPVYSQLFIAELQVGKNGYGFLLDSSNIIIVHPVRQFIGNRYFQQEKFLNDGGQILQGFFKYTFQGEQKIAYGSRIEDLEATLIVSVPLAELLEPAKQLRWINFFVTLFVCFVSLVFLLILWRREVSQPVTDLLRGISEFKTGKLLKPVTSRARNEFHEVAISFNEMIDDIEKSTVSISELKEQQENLQTILDSMAIGVLIFDNSRRLRSINAALLAMLDLADVQQIENIDALPGVTANIVENPVSEVEVSQKEGKKIYLLRSVHLITLSNEEVYLATFVDITERKKQEQERRKMEQDLQAVSRIKAVGTLGAGIAHEINTPIQYVTDNIRFFEECSEQMIAEIIALNATIDSARKLESVAPLNANQREKIDLEYLQDEVPVALSQSIDGLEHISRIVKALKLFSQHSDEKMSDYNLNEGVENTIAVTLGEWRDSVEMVTSLDTSIPLVRCCVGDINQVLLSLIVNSVDAILEKIKQQNLGKGEIHIATYLEDNYVCLSVVDNGIGMGPETQARVFEPFFTTKDVGSGSGQGMTFARRIVVDRHNGIISFESEMGVGTSFLVKLPLKSAGNKNG